MADKLSVIPAGRIEKCIFLMRGHKVMLSTHLAELYEVEPRALVESVLSRRRLRVEGQFLCHGPWRRN